jgi:hypothetical protein
LRNGCGGSVKKARLKGIYFSDERRALGAHPENYRRKVKARLLRDQGDSTMVAFK